MAEIRDGMGRLRWAKGTGMVRPSTVVVPNIFREHCTQVPLIEDQDAVGEFGSNSADEPFGKTVRLAEQDKVLIEALERFRVPS